MERQAERARRVRHERRVPVGVVAQHMVKVCDVNVEAQVLSEFNEQPEKGGRVRAPGDRGDDHVPDGQHPVPPNCVARARHQRGRSRHSRPLRQVARPFLREKWAPRSWDDSASRHPVGGVGTSVQEEQEVVAAEGLEPPTPRV